MNFLICSVTAILLTVLQTHLPAIAGLRLEFLPAVVAYGALTYRRPLWLPLVVGFTQDALSASPFGLSALAYGIAATTLASLRETFDRDLPWVQMGAGAFASTVASCAACCVVGFGGGAPLKLLLLAAISAVVTPMLFIVLDYIRYRARTA